MAPRARIGTAIRRGRERKRWTQQRLADELGVSRATVDAWENDRSYPRSSIGALEEILGISLDGRPAGLPGLVPEDEWEAEVLADPDLPDRIKAQLIADSRAARAAYAALRAERRAARARGQVS